MVVDVKQKRIDNFRGQKMATEADRNFSKKTKMNIGIKIADPSGELAMIIILLCENYCSWLVSFVEQKK